MRRRTTRPLPQPRPVTLDDDAPQHAALAAIVVAVSAVHGGVVDDQHVALAPDWYVISGCSGRADPTCLTPAPASCRRCAWRDEVHPGEPCTGGCAPSWVCVLLLVLGPRVRRPSRLLNVGSPQTALVRQQRATPRACSPRGAPAGRDLHAVEDGGRRRLGGVIRVPPLVGAGGGQSSRSAVRHVVLSVVLLHRRSEHRRRGELCGAVAIDRGIRANDRSAATPRASGRSAGSDRPADLGPAWVGGVTFNAVMASISSAGQAGRAAPRRRSSR